MARKTKKKKIVEITPSKYQEAIFDFVKNGNGNVVVEACAGSGKSWTLIKCLDYINKDKNVLLTAFNRDIVNELNKKAKLFPNVTVSTLHSLGLSLLQKNFPDRDLKLDVFKYKSYVSTNIKTLSSIDIELLSNSDFFRYLNNIYTFVDFGRSYLCQTIKDLDFIENRYAIETIADEKEIALDVIEFGKNNLDLIDYTDMIWLPVVLSVKPIGHLYDWIFLDEGQDLTVCQREILLKCRKINTRICIFGDSEQSLYAFSSADPESFKKLKKLPNTISLPLSISYRCPEKIVDLAKTLVPTIESSGDGRKGEVVENIRLDEIKDGDMVLCRNNAPLMKVYNSFLKEGKKCFIRGKDIGLNLKNNVKKTKKEILNKSLKSDGVFVRLYDNVFDTIRVMVGKYNLSYEEAANSALVSNKLDMIKSLEILSDGISTATELNERIDTIFSDRKTGGIALSTIHKAKGLEADNVYIACKHLMPSKYAKKDWEKRQEENLRYVAYTRAKTKLGFIADSEIEGFGENEGNTITNLKKLEEKINTILHKKPITLNAENPYVAKEIIRHATKIEKPKHETKILSFSETIEKKNKSSLNDLVKRRISVKRRK